jgi:stringent starvation protein B
MSDDTASMTSSRPYLLRALNEWIVDNHLTPYIVVDAQYENVIVPRQFIENGKIVLNISPFAVRDLTVDNEYLLFSARFSGKSMDVTVPISSVLAIYAKENGQGMVFTDAPTPPSGGPSTPSESTKKPGKPDLKLIK